MSHFNLAVRAILTVWIMLVFSSCKKEERSAAEWGELASAKREEIQNLTLNISCTQKSNVTIHSLSQGCSVQYFAIHDTDLSKYEKLKKEYIEFSDKQWAAWSREGLIVEPCHETIWASEQPIRLECQEDKVKLVTSANVGIAEAKALVDGTYELITKFVDDQICTSNAAWTYTPLISYKTMKIEVIPYSRTGDYSALKEKVSLYNRLTFRIIEAEGTGPNFQHGKEVDKIECENNKPVIKYKN